jgi:PAS domain S-box-containing protein
MIAADNKAHTDFLLGAGEMGARIREFDWSTTPLGAIEFWPQSLKTSVSLILTSRHPMWIGWGPEMTFFYNDAYLHVLGAAKHPHALGRPASEVWAEIWDICGPLAEKVFQSGEASFVDDVRLFMDRGDLLEETFYSFSYSPIRDESGKVSGLFCPSTDVTPKIVNARRLRTLSELASSALAETTTTGACAITARTLRKYPDDIPFALLYLADAKGKWAKLEQVVGNFGDDTRNMPALDLAGDSEVKPWPVVEVFRTAQRQIVAVEDMPNLPLGVANQRVRDAVVLPVTSRAEHRPFGVLVAGINPCRPLDQEHLAFLDLLAGQVATAIQNVKTIEEEKKRGDMLAEVDRVKTAFFSNVSHEFRTPLTLMLGPLESLLAKPESLSSEDHEQLAIAHRNSLRLLKLVNSLLDFSRIEAGRIKASYAPADLSVLTADLASNFRSAMQATGLELIVDCEPLPEPVYVDVEMWEKIVLNLLSNAFKFTLQGNITVRLRSDEGHAVLTVSDTGTGIPEAELPRIFERFYRIEGARGRTYEGTGIGLALVQELIKLHGGSIAVTSRAGRGSTFTVRVPFGTAHLPRKRIESVANTQLAGASRVGMFLGEAESWRSLQGQSSDPAPPDQPSGTRIRPHILVVDDNADMREHVTRILGHDYKISTALDGNQAVELVRQNAPDLVLTDVMMPGLGGFGLLRALRADPSTATIPVIFISARAGEEMRVEGLEAGGDDYLVKPFTASELRARVGAHVHMAIARRGATEQEAALRAEAEQELAQRKRVELELRKSEERLRTIVETTPECVKLVARDGTLLHMNSSGLAMVGAQSAEAVLGKSVYDLIAPEFRQAFREFHERICKGEKGSLEFDITGLQGQRRRVESRAVPFRDPDGSIVQLAVTHDITERKVSERASLLLGAIVDSSDDAIVSKDLNGIITSWNKGAERLFGYTADEVIGRSITIIIPSDRLGEEPEILSRLQRGERIEHFETIRRRKDGLLLDISLTISPVKDAREKIIGASKIARDITERKRAELALLASESRFRQLADSMPQMVWTARPDGVLDYYNEQWYKFTGFDSQKSGDFSWDSILHPEDAKQSRKNWHSAVTTGEPYQIEHRFWDRHENRWRWFMTRALPVHDSDRNIVKWFGTCTDIDEQKRVQEQLRHVNQDLEQFAYSASHDLQEPLRGIKIYSELLTHRHSNKLDGQALEFLHYLRESASRMEMLVRDLLAYTQVSKLETSEDKADANEALTDVLANLHEAIMESGARITSDPLPCVRVHDTHLKQLFQNLLGNAIKYRDFDRIPTVHVQAKRREGDWLFSVIDNGIGIEPEYKERIFGLFKRLHSGDEYPGTGIGLAICQRIVERYHGRIWVESEPGQGSTFLFTLPV